MHKYKSLIVVAGRHQCTGNNQECMRCLCRALEILFSKRIDPLVSLACRRLPLPNIGLRLLRTETGIRVEMSKSEYVAADTETGLSYTVEMQKLLFCSSWVRHLFANEAMIIPRLTIAESCVLILNKVIRRCLKSGQRLKVKRYLLHALHILRGALSRCIPHCREQSMALSEMLGLIFHEPEARMKKLLGDYQFYFELNYAKRLLHLESGRESRQTLHEFHWPMQQAYKKYIEADNGSRVLVSIHMGDFAGAFRAISALANAERGAITLRRETETEDNSNLLFLEKLQHCVFRHGQNNSVAIVNALRGGNHTLAVLFDLKDEFGKTVEVEFFGRRASIVKGPAQLAIIGKADLFPFVTYEENGINCIDMEPIISSQLLPGESMQRAVKRITQQLVKLAEKWIRKNPAQWKYLSSLPGFIGTATEKMAEIPDIEVAIPVSGIRD